MLTGYAKRGGVSIADAGQPNYLVRGYLSADSEGDAATIVSYVLDVFDAENIARSALRTRSSCAARRRTPGRWSMMTFWPQWRRKAPPTSPPS